MAFPWPLFTAAELLTVQWVDGEWTLHKSLCSQMLFTSGCADATVDLCCKPNWNGLKQLQEKFRKKNLTLLQGTDLQYGPPESCAVTAEEE